MVTNYDPFRKVNRPPYVSLRKNIQRNRYPTVETENLIVLQYIFSICPEMALVPYQHYLGRLYKDMRRKFTNDQVALLVHFLHGLRKPYALLS